MLHKGVVEVRIETIGFGEKQPVADNGTAEGRAPNRRVEISLFPITEGQGTGARRIVSALQINGVARRLLH